MRLFILLVLMISSGNTKYLLVDVNNENDQTQIDDNFVDDDNSDSNDDDMPQDYSIFDPLDRATVQCPPGQVRGSSGSRCYPARHNPAINVRESILTARKGPLVKAQVQEIGRTAGIARRTGRSLG